MLAACGTPTEPASPHPATAIPGAAGAYQPSKTLVWLQGGSAVLVSRDGGASWRRTLGGNPDTRVVATFFLGTKDAWAVAVGSSNRLFRSADGGVRWTAVSLRRQVGDGTQLFFLNPERGWLLLPGSSSTRLLSTNNGGRSWRPMSTRGLPAAGAVPRCGQAAYPLLNFSTNMAGALADPCPTRGGLLLVTSDGGHRWHRQQLPNVVSQSARVAVTDPIYLTPDQGVLAVGYSGGRMQFAVSYDAGQNWFKGGKALSTGSKTALAPFGLLAPGRWAVGGAGKLFLTKNQGMTWKVTKTPSDLTAMSYLNLLPDGSGLAALAGRVPGVLLSRDHGERWAPASLPRSS